MNFNNIINDISAVLNNPKDYIAKKRHKNNKTTNAAKNAWSHSHTENANVQDDIAWDENGDPIEAYWDTKASIERHCKKMGLKIKK